LSLESVELGFGCFHPTFEVTLAQFEHHDRSLVFGGYDFQVLVLA
jgi:hypothetical protein